MVFAIRCCNSSKLFSVSDVDGTSLPVRRAQVFAAKSQTIWAWRVSGNRIKPRVEQHLGLDVLCLAMRLRLGEQAGKAAENLQESGHGCVVESHVMLFS